MRFIRRNFLLLAAGALALPAVSRFAWAQAAVQSKAGTRLITLGTRAGPRLQSPLRSRHRNQQFFLRPPRKGRDLFAVFVARPQNQKMQKPLRAREEAMLLLLTNPRLTSEMPMAGRPREHFVTPAESGSRCRMSMSGKPGTSVPKAWCVAQQSECRLARSHFRGGRRAVSDGLEADSNEAPAPSRPFLLVLFARGSRH